MRNRALTILTFAFPVLCAVLIVLFCAALANAQVGGGTGGGNPPSEIRRGTNRAQIDISGNFAVDLLTGKVIILNSTCTGAAVSATGKATLCYDNTASPKAIKISVNGDAYSSLLTVATAPTTAPGGAANTIQYNNGGTFGGVSGATSDGTGLFIQDSSLTITGSGSTSKRARFEVDGFGLGATWTFTLPNYSATIATQGGLETFTNKTLTQPTIGDFTNATHSHTNAAGGGSLDAAAIGSGAFDANRIPGTLNAVTAPSVTVSGAAGAGFLELPEQASAPGTPTNAARFFVDSSNRFSWKGENGFARTFDGTANTADRVYVLPDAAGTIALTSNISSPPFDDGTAILKDSGDATKLLRFELGGFTTATTRIITPPNANTNLPVYGATITYTGPTAARTVTYPDANFTIARTDAAQTFTGTQTFLTTITTPASAAALQNSGATSDLFFDSTSGTLFRSNTDVVVGIDQDNNSTSQKFQVKTNVNTFANGTVLLEATEDGKVGVNSGGMLCFSSVTTNPLNGNLDTCLVRGAANVIDLTNGSTGNGKLRIDRTNGAPIVGVLSNSATLDFPNTLAQTDADLTITVTGAADGDVCSVGVPNGSTQTGSLFSCWVSAANTVTVRFSVYGITAKDPASGTFRVQVTKF